MYIFEMIMMHVINVNFNKTPFLLYNNIYNWRLMNGNLKNKFSLMSWKIYWWTQRPNNILNSKTFQWMKIWLRSWREKAPWRSLMRSRKMVNSFQILTSRFLLMKWRDSFKINIWKMIWLISLSVIFLKFQFLNWLHLSLIQGMFLNFH